jgi:hypothetical protein
MVDGMHRVFIEGLRSCPHEATATCSTPIKFVLLILQTLILFSEKFGIHPTPRSFHVYGFAVIRRAPG